MRNKLYSLLLTFLLPIIGVGGGVMSVFFIILSTYIAGHFRNLYFVIPFMCILISLGIYASFGFIFLFQDKVLNKIKELENGNNWSGF